VRQGKHRQLQLSPRCLPFLSREQAGSIEPSLKTVNLPCRDSSQRKRSSDVSISGPEQKNDVQKYSHNLLDKVERMLMTTQSK